MLAMVSSIEEASFELLDDPNVQMGFDPRSPEKIIFNFFRIFCENPSRAAPQSFQELS